MTAWTKSTLTAFCEKHALGDYEIDSWGRAILAIPLQDAKISATSPQTGRRSKRATAGAPKVSAAQFTRWMALRQFSNQQAAEYISENLPGADGTDRGAIWRIAKGQRSASPRIAAFVLRDLARID